MRDVDLFSSVEKSSWAVEPFSSFEKPLSKGKRIRELKSLQDSQMEKEKERILSEQKNIHELLDKKADQAFQKQFAAQTRLFEAQAGLDRRECSL